MSLDTPAISGTDAQSANRLDLGALPFILSIFVGAVLIFLVQPMFAKMATPLLGGSPSVWNVSLVCFQAALLGGYGYAHILGRLKSVRTQVLIHGLVFLSGTICLPLGLTGVFGDPSADHPALWLIGVFLLSVALPFAAVSATSPLIQSWYARTNRADADDPYYLYAASNIGSLIGLAAYPLLMEPFTRVATQSASWAAGYGVLFFLLMGSGFVAFRGSLARQAQASVEEARASLSWKERFIWLGLAFIPSSLLVGATTHITTDVAAAPFLWVPPLTLYLLTFVLVFAKKPPIPQAVILRFQPVVMAGVVLVLPHFIDVGWFLELALTLLGLFWASMTCHGLLAERRPHVSRLTEFYLLMSLGGVLGGAFNALVAPVIFDLVLEYPLVLAASLLVLPATQSSFDGRGRVLFGILAAVVAVILFNRIAGISLSGGSAVIFIALPTIMIVLARGRRFLMVSSFAVSVFAGLMLNPYASGTSERGFFGIVKVLEIDGRRAMMHGTTLHGAQFLEGDRVLQPLTYYGANTPIGQTFHQYNDAETVGVVGLGVGSVACYGTPGQDWVFFEIDPIVVNIAKDPDQFTFLSECQPDARMVVGDARVQLTYEDDRFFDLLLLDAFSSDSIPVHLVTREAMRLYLSKLDDDGVFIAHISNRHMALEQVFARLAALEGAVALVQKYQPTAEQREEGQTATHAMLFAKNEAALSRALATGDWERIESDGKRPWTDDYTNILAAMLAFHQN